MSAAMSGETMPPGLQKPHESDSLSKASTAASMSTFAGSSLAGSSLAGSSVSDPVRVNLSSNSSAGFPYSQTPEPSFPIYQMQTEYIAKNQFFEDQEERLRKLYIERAQAKEAGRDDEVMTLDAAIKAKEGLYGPGSSYKDNTPYKDNSPAKINSAALVQHDTESETELLRKKVAALEANIRNLEDEKKKVRSGSTVEEDDMGGYSGASPPGYYGGVAADTEMLRERYAAGVPADTTEMLRERFAAGLPGLHPGHPLFHDPLLASQYPYAPLVPPMGMIPPPMHQPHLGMVPPGYGMDPYGLSAGAAAAAYQEAQAHAHAAMQMAVANQAGAQKAAKGVGKAVKGKPVKLVDDANKPTEEVVNELEREINLENDKIKKANKDVEDGLMGPEGYEALREATERRIQEYEVKLAPLNEILRNKGVKTVMVRNIPNDYKRSDLTDLLDKKGFSKKYDFVYLPYDFHRESGLGYAFVNMVSFQDAQDIKRELSGYNNWNKKSQKVVEVNWGHPVQGKAEHIERYRNSPVMHQDIQDEYKPALYEDGVKIPFPAPTRAIQPPRKKSTKAK